MSHGELQFVFVWGGPCWHLFEHQLAFVSEMGSLFVLSFRGFSYVFRNRWVYSIEEESLKCCCFIFL